MERFALALGLAVATLVGIGTESALSRLQFRLSQELGYLRSPLSSGPDVRQSLYQYPQCLLTQLYRKDALYADAHTYSTTWQQLKLLVRVGTASSHSNKTPALNCRKMHNAMVSCIEAEPLRRGGRRFVSLGRRIAPLACFLRDN